MCERYSPPTQALPRAGQSGRTAPFKGFKYFGRSEPYGTAEFEGWDQAGNAPFVELAAADFEKGGEFGLGKEFEFEAQWIGWCLHARGCEVNLRAT